MSRVDRFGQSTVRKPSGELGYAALLLPGPLSLVGHGHVHARDRIRRSRGMRADGTASVAGEVTAERANESRQPSRPATRRCPLTGSHAAFSAPVRESWGVTASRRRSGPATQHGDLPALPARDRAALREAQVRFEMDRWQQPHLEQTLREETQALIEWLDTVTVADVLPAAATADLVDQVCAGLDVTDELVGLVVALVLAARTGLAGSEETFAEVVERDDMHDVVRIAIAMPDLRTRAIEAMTDNPAYHELVAHLLYHGVKAFMLCENVFARRVPGAQSLIRFGQRSLNTAAPGFEEGVDRTLQRFVQGQIGETLSDSKRFIEHYLTSGAADELVDAVYASMGPTRLREVGAVVSEDDAVELVEAARPMVEHVLRSGLAGRLASETIERVLTSYQDRPVLTLLGEFGLDRDVLLARLAQAGRPIAAHAVDTGYLEQRLRARLDAFYETLPEPCSPAPAGA